MASELLADLGLHGFYLLAGQVFALHTPAPDVDGLKIGQVVKRLVLFAADRHCETVQRTINSCTRRRNKVESKCDIRSQLVLNCDLIRIKSIWNYLRGYGEP